MNQFALSLSFLVFLAFFAVVQMQPVIGPVYFASYDQIPEKKSHEGLTDFTSALNGASRLRYGKRGYFNLDPEAQEWNQKFQEYSKRASSVRDVMPQFVQNLNGAERLRFG